MKCLKRCIAIIGVLIVAACSNRSNPDIDEAKKAVEEVLLDPGSVTYRTIITKKNDGYVTVCGEVNAKNSLGGYVGYKPFIYNASGTKTLQMDDIYPSDITLYCAE